MNDQANIETLNSACKTLPTDIGIESDDRESVCGMMQSVLADQHVLYIKKRNFHWNLVGERFHTLHTFYEEQYTALEAAIDKTAERIRQLGGVAAGSMQEFLSAASLKEEVGALVDGEDSIRALVTDHESVIKTLRTYVSKTEEAGDAGTADFLTALMQSHEEMAWMLRSFLQH